MSGYLQRLVRTVAQPGESIHPRTGSIYSPHRKEASAPPLHEWEEIEAATVSQPRAETHASPPDVDLPEPVRRGEPRSAHVPLVAKSNAPETPRATEQSPPLMASAPFWGTSSRLEAVEQQREAQQEEKISVKAPASPVADRRYRALMKPSGITEARKEFAPPRQMRPERRAEKTEWQPDEIQIHIGRIEVTALPPSAPVRAPKQPDRALSLDAYLNRREGRAR